jgi:hypothetical protein
MSKKRITDLLQECSEVAGVVLPSIENVLDNNEIEYGYNGDSEIVITGKSKDDIKPLLNDVEGVTKEQMKMLIQISELNGNVYIRQVMK